MATSKIKKGDTVRVIAGVDKGKEGKVLEVKGTKVKVEGVNKVKKHVKPSQTNAKGGIIEEEAAPFLFGLFSKKASTKGAFVSAGIGVALTLALQFGNGGKGLWILNATSTGILAAAIMMFISLFVFPRKEKAQ